VARVEEISESSDDHVGVGAVIEAYKFGQTESSACLSQRLSVVGSRVDS
jgi:hypothetical protein